MCLSPIFTRWTEPCGKRGCRNKRDRRFAAAADVPTDSPQPEQDELTPMGWLLLAHLFGSPRCT
jgi:hypothetical protein